MHQFTLSIQSHMHMIMIHVYIYICLAGTCHVCIWKNDRDLVYANVGVEWNKSLQKVGPGEESSPATPAGTLTCDLSSTSSVHLTLSPNLTQGS